ncbi:MAG: DUF885 domain-containing protein [Xanthomonadales bacterium]|nr:DUF885 domain-containing protein [Xanthomonadales bacterium]
MQKLVKSLLIIFFFVSISGCSEENETVTNEAVQDQSVSEVVTEVIAETITEAKKANDLFETIFMQGVKRSPVFQSFLGIKDDQDKWDNLSEEWALEGLQIHKDNLVKVNLIDASKLDPQTEVSLSLMKQGLQQRIDDYKWRLHNYPLNQMRGHHSAAPALLINQHKIQDVTDAEDYISRLNAIPALFDQVIENLNIRAEKGIIAPKFVYPYVISDSENIIKGVPFDDGAESPLMADFSRKVNKLDLDAAEKEALINRAVTALKESVKPGYESLIQAVKVIEEKADTQDGVWKLPDGQAFYNNALVRTTTTDMTAEQIHQTGLTEVARIHAEMELIKTTVGFEGDLNKFFGFMRDDDQFYYADDEEGREKYLTEATAFIDTMKTHLDELFIVKPKAELTVKAVEAFREKSAGKAFYQTPSMDGARPGIYYANLYQMRNMPTYQMEALAYHEGLPGHHMQLAIALELEGIPKFRKYSRFTAYTEGWGLYSEKLPKEIGMYSDPYSDFGRLAMELWRACRLVVDTGIHAMKWSREQGIEYYVNNTPNSRNDAVKMVERHIVMASQATAYKIGMMKILELREKAKTALNDQFDIRDFHQVVLKNGPLPLDVLTQYVDEYIAEELTQ